MAKSIKPNSPNWPSKTGNPSGKGRTVNPPAPKASKGSKK